MVIHIINVSVEAGTVLFSVLLCIEGVRRFTCIVFLALTFCHLPLHHQGVTYCYSFLQELLINEGASTVKGSFRFITT